MKILTFIILLISATVNAENVNIMEISQVPELKNYENDSIIASLDGIGTVEKLINNEIEINGEKYFLTTETKYFDLTKNQMDSTSITAFHEGCIVGFVKNTENEIIELKKLENYDNYGSIERIGNFDEKNEIVINDSLYYFTNDVQIYSNTGGIISRSRIKVSDKVGFTINDSGLITSIWKL